MFMVVFRFLHIFHVLLLPNVIELFPSNKDWHKAEKDRELRLYCFSPRGGLELHLLPHSICPAVVYMTFFLVVFNFSVIVPRCFDLLFYSRLQQPCTPPSDSLATDLPIGDRKLSIYVTHVAHARLIVRVGLMCCRVFGCFHVSCVAPPGPRTSNL